MDQTFKTCTICSQRWDNMLDLIRDENLFINGYQASFNDAHEGLFMFTHTVNGCGTTFAIPAGKLTQLYNGPEHTIHMAYTEQCAGHCQHEEDLSPCPNDCSMRWARDILQILINHGPDELLEQLLKPSNDEAAA
jgi:hypothetical protein